MRRSHSDCNEGSPSLHGRDIVIVGAGILGAALAWQLGRQGQGHRVVLLDRAMPMAGATGRAAALVTLLRKDRAQIRMAQETLAAIAGFEGAEAGSVGLHRSGSLHVVPARLNAMLDAQVQACRDMGVRMEWVGQAQAALLAPWLRVPEHAAVLHVVDDCYVDPYQLGMAYLRGAQQHGVRLLQDTEVTDILVRDGAVCGVATRGDGCICAASVVLAAGPWSNILAAPAGVPLPQAPVRSQYWVTASAEELPRQGAIVFLPEIRAYARPEVGGLLFGLREAQTPAVDARLLPADLAGFSFDVSDTQGWASLADGAADLGRYWPGLEHAPIAHYVSGPSSYTSDGQLLVGPAPALHGMWVIAGCNGSGITLSAGMGRLLSEQLLGQSPTFVDGSAMAVQRQGLLDPFEPSFMARCAAARAGKSTG